MDRAPRRCRRQIGRYPDRIWGIAVPVVFALQCAGVALFLVFFFIVPTWVDWPGSTLVTPVRPMSFRTATIVTFLAISAYALLWTVFAAVHLVRAGRPVLRVDLGRFLAFGMFFLLSLFVTRAAFRLRTASDCVAAARTNARHCPSTVVWLVRSRIAGTRKLCEELRNERDPALSFLGAVGLYRLGDRSEKNRSIIHRSIDELRTSPPAWPDPGEAPPPSEYEDFYMAQDLLLHPGQEVGFITIRVR